MNKLKETFLNFKRKEIVTPDSNISFARKYLIPGIALILSLVSIGQFYLSTITENELIEVVGKIISINKLSNEKVIIYLEGNTNPFYFFEKNSYYINEIINEVKLNDIISIKHRTKFQSLVGTGKELQIVHLSKDSKVIYNFNNFQKMYFERGKFGLLCSLIMLLLYIWLKIRYEVR